MLLIEGNEIKEGTIGFEIIDESSWDVNKNFKLPRVQVMLDEIDLINKEGEKLIFDKQGKIGTEKKVAIRNKLYSFSKVLAVIQIVLSGIKLVDTYKNSKEEK